MANTDRFELRPGRVILSLNTEKNFGAMVAVAKFPIADPEVRWEVVASRVEAIRPPCWIDVRDIWSSKEGKIDRPNGFHEDYTGLFDEGDKGIHEELSSVGMRLKMTYGRSGDVEFSLVKLEQPRKL